VNAVWGEFALGWSFSISTATFGLSQCFFMPMARDSCCFCGAIDKTLFLPVLTLFSTGPFPRELFFFD